MTTPTIITPDVLIQKRDNFIAEIKKCWSIINNNNVFTNGQKQNFDLLEVYKVIKKNESELVRVKVILQAINMGLKKLEDLPSDNSFTSVVLLSQIKERMVKLNLIPTKKEEGESVIFTRRFIEEQTKELNAAKEEIEEELRQFNKNIQFSM